MRTNTPAIALIPAYQPENTLLDLVLELKAHGFTILIVNDGSSIEYDFIFSECSSHAVILTQARNQGKGAALKRGFLYIQEHFEKDCPIVTMDADGQHTVTDALRLLDALAGAPDALVLGSRALREGVPLRSQIGNTCTRFIYRLSTGIAVHDTQTGLRAFSAHLLPTLLSIEGDRYEYEMNVLLYAPKHGIPIRELPIETIYLAGNQSSHFDAVKDSIRIYKQILKFSASSFVSFLVDYSLFILFTALLPGSIYGISTLLAANVLARLLSASVNYTLNRRLVFQHEGNAGRSALRYSLLVLAILILNSITLQVFTGILGITPTLAKLCVELLFFCLSFLMQKKFVFRQPERKKTRVKEQQNAVHSIAT